MEDIMLIEYLRKKGILTDSEYSELVEKPHHVEKEPMYNQPHKSDKYSNFFSNFKEVTRDMNQSEKGQFVDRLKDYGNISFEHFNESYAKYVVSKMSHRDSVGVKYSGEKYDMMKAKEVCERYRGLIPSSITYSDIYVAINYQYHSYSCLFKKWFGDDIDCQIIESAIMFWFKDDSHPSKLWDQFK